IDGDILCHRDPPAPSGRTCPFRTQTQAIGLAASGLGYARSARWAEQEQIARWAETSRANRPSSPPHPHAPRPRVSARWAETLGSTISEYRRATINAFRSRTSTARFSGTTSLLMMRNTFGIKPSAGESRPNGPTEHSPGLRPQADALGAAFHKTDCARKGRRRFTLHSRVHRRGHFVSSRPSGPFRAHMSIPHANPGHRPCGLRPGLCSVGPLGRTGADCPLGRDIPRQPAELPTSSPCPSAQGFGPLGRDPGFNDFRIPSRHHKRVSFQDEYRAFLRHYELAYDEKYVWD